MSKINLDKIVTIQEYKENINEDNFEVLKKISNSVEKKLTFKNNTYSYLDKTSREFPRIKHPNLSFIEKEFVSTSIMFTESNFIETLLCLNISYDKLKNICSNLSIYKKLHDIDPTNDKFESKNFLSIESNVIKICNYICKYYNCKDFYLAANKLTYLVAFEEDLYKSLENQKTKKLQY